MLMFMSQTTCQVSMAVLIWFWESGVKLPVMKLKNDGQLMKQSKCGCPLLTGELAD